MTGINRRSILAVVALATSACVSPVPTQIAPSPIAVASDAPSPTIRPPASQEPIPLRTPIPLATPIPGGPCPAFTPDRVAATPDFEVRTPLGFASLDVQIRRVVPKLRPDDVIEYAAEQPYLGDPIRLVGRWEISIFDSFDQYDVTPWPTSLHELSAVVRIRGRSPVSFEATLGIDARVERPAWILKVPDVGGRAVIDFVASWSDRCYTYEGTTSRRFEMVTAAFAARCPSDSEGFAAYWAALGAPPTTIGGLPVSLFRSSTLGIWTPYAVSAQGAVGFDHWDPAAAAAIGSAGGTVTVDPGNPDLRLESLSTEFYRRRDIVEWIGGGNWPGRDLIVFGSGADPYADGHLEMLLPQKPGRYVASFSFNWSSMCAHGDGVGAIGVRTR